MPRSPMPIPPRRLLLVMTGFALTMAAVLVSACAPPEDPARVALRERASQEGRLSDDDLTKLRAEVSRTIAGKKVSLEAVGVTRPLAEDERPLILGMLEDPAGLFDEGLKRENGVVLRVLNAPAESANAEIEAARRLYVDVETFLPRRFEFFHAFEGYGDYSFDLEFEEP